MFLFYVFHQILLLYGVIVLDEVQSVYEIKSHVPVFLKS